MTISMADALDMIAEDLDLGASEVGLHLGAIPVDDHRGTWWRLESETPRTIVRYGVGERAGDGPVASGPVNWERVHLREMWRRPGVTLTLVCDRALAPRLCVFTPERMLDPKW